MNTFRALGGCLIVLSILLPGATAFGQGASRGNSTGSSSSYTLGVGDLIQLSVWQQPDLDRQLRVREDGTIVVPLLGEMPASGSTVPQLEAELSRRLRNFDRNLTEVSLTIISYNSFTVFIMGAVSSPGEYSFDGVPNPWDAVRAAGGPAPSANLARVRILRHSGSGSTTIRVDLADILSGESSIDEYPPLLPGDTVVVPDLRRVGAGDQDSGVHILGQVSTPGLYPLDEPAPLLGVVLQAGGFSKGADLSKVRWVHPTDEGPIQARSLDVRRYLRSGQQQLNPMIHPGDTIFVEESRGGWNWTGVLSASTGLVAILLNVLNR